MLGLSGFIQIVVDGFAQDSWGEIRIDLNHPGFFKIKLDHFRIVLDFFGQDPTCQKIFVTYFFSKVETIWDLFI